MILGQWKLRVKMLMSFAGVLFLAALLGIVGLSSIGKINVQNEIAEDVNRVLVDTQDVQAASLRFIIYGDDSYQEIMITETENVFRNAAAAQALMTKAENQKNIDVMTGHMEAYEKSNAAYYELASQKETLNSLRSAAAGQTLAGITALFEEEIDPYVAKNGIDLEYYQGVRNLQELRNSYNRVRVWAQKYNLATDGDEQDRIAQEWISEINVSRSHIETGRKDFSGDPEMTSQLASVDEALEKYSGYVEEFRRINRAQREEQAVQRDSAAEVLTYARKVRDGVDAIVMKTTSQAMLFVIVILAAALVFGFAISLILTRSVMAQLGGEPDEISDIVAHIARGNLMIDFDDRVEKGVYKSTKTMTNDLSYTMSDIRNASDQVTSGSTQISTSSQQISAGASEQASSVEEISSSMEELASNIEQNTSNAKKADDIAKNVAEEAAVGGESVNETVSAMKSIAEKIQIIEEIARNTNMLALNAAIEAARAGEAGKGFAVVADEVRKLAENSGRAASEITEISTNSVEAAEKAGVLITELVPKIKETADLVQEITVASEEQSRGAEQINTALQQLDTVIQQNASASEELASMSEELNSQAEMMKSGISYFKLRDREEAPQVTPPPSERTADRPAFLPVPDKTETEQDDSFIEF